MTSEAILSDANLPQVGQVLAGKYRIERLLGKGGMGVVFAAHHELLGVRVAVKLLLTEIAQNPDAVQRFVNEARNAARIQSDNVARVMDVGTLENGQPFMVIEFLEGDDLAQVLDSRGPLPLEEAVDYVLQALEAIAQAHVMGIVHRDLKPANLFLVRRQDRMSQVKVLDFGISKSTNPLSQSSGSMTSTKALLGSPYYMSPEQLRSSKTVDARADIWSMGIILYELLTGHPPFQAETFGELFATILEEEPSPLRNKRPDVPIAFEAIVVRCLRRKADERFRNVGELAHALAPFASARGQRAAQHILDVIPLDAESFRNLQAGPSPSIPDMRERQASGAALSGPFSGPSTGSGQHAMGASSQGGQTNGSWGAGVPAKAPASSMVPWLAAGGVVVVVLIGVIGTVIALRHPSNATVEGDPSASATASVASAASAEPPPSAAASVAPPPSASVATPVEAAASAAPTASTAAAHSTATSTGKQVSHHTTTQQHHETTTSASAKPAVTATPLYDPTKDSRR